MSQPREASRTAAGVAWLRAAHQVVDSPPLILDDPIAPALFGDAAVHLAERRAEPASACALALRAHVLPRSRFPWLTFSHPDELVLILREAGFSSVQFLTREQAEVRYFTGRGDALRTPRRVSIATATV